MITTNFPGGNVTSFDINNIYLGCFLSANTADAEVSLFSDRRCLSITPIPRLKRGLLTPPSLQAPQACSISMTGYKGRFHDFVHLSLHSRHQFPYNLTMPALFEPTHHPANLKSLRLSTGSDNSVANAQQVCSYTANYNPSTNLGDQQMTDSGPFPSTCKGLQFLVFLFTIQPATVNSLQERLSLGIDNVDVDTYHC